MSLDKEIQKFAEELANKGKKKAEPIYYRKGLLPRILPSQRHPAKVLFSQGWRTDSQIRCPKKVRGKGLLAKVGDKEYDRIVAPQPQPPKQVRKNPASKLYEFFLGRYHSKTA